MMDICPKCGTELPIIGGGAYCANCGEALAVRQPDGSGRPAPSTWTMPTDAITSVDADRADPYAGLFRPAPGEAVSPTRTQVMPAIDPTLAAMSPQGPHGPQALQAQTPYGGPGPILVQPAYDQPIDYQAGPGRPYSEPYEGPYENEYDDSPPRPRANRGATIGIGVAGAAVLVIVVSLITIGGGGKAPAAQTPNPTQVINPTDAGPSNTQAASKSPDKPTSTAPTAPSSTPHAGGLLEFGDSGNDVKWLQSRLKQLHMYNGDATGTFDQATLAAVQQFQKKAHTSDPSGVVGRSTKTALYAAGSRPKLTMTGGLFGGDKPKPDDVKRLQHALSSALGTNVAASGDYDMATVGAVMHYQSSVGLGPDGSVGDKTWAALQAGKVSG